MAIQGRLYHVGIVVPDVEVAKAHFTDLLGITWGPVVETEGLLVREGDGAERIVPNTLCYSTEPPYVELVQEVPARCGSATSTPTSTTSAVWTDALRCGLRHVHGAAVPAAAVRARRRRRRRRQFAYHRDPLGVRIELVDLAMKPMMEEFMFRAPLA